MDKLMRLRAKKKKKPHNQSHHFRFPRRAASVMYYSMLHVVYILS